MRGQKRKFGTVANNQFNDVVLKVVDIDPKGSIGPAKGSINSYGVEWRSLNGSEVLSMFSDCVLCYHAFQVKSTDIYFDTYFPCIRNCWARPRGLQKIVYLNWGSTCRKV